MTALWLFSLFMLGYFLRAPTLASKAAYAALKFCAVGLIPSLFPFIVLVGIINGSGLSFRISALIGKPIAWLLGLSPASAYAVVLGAIGGFPIGAVCTRELYEKGDISLCEAEHLCSITNNAGPAFCIGGIGAAMFGDTLFGVKLYLCQIAAALLIGLVLRGKKSKERALIPSSSKQKQISEIVTEAVANGGQTMLKVCSFAIFFAVIADAVCMIVEPTLGKGATALITSFCELTAACRRCAMLDGLTARALAAFSVGYSGLSVHMQVASILSGSGIKLSRYHVCKLISGILCMLLICVLEII